MTTSVRETMARESLRVRALRAHYFPDDIFAEFAWVLLLHAYLRHIGGTVSEDGEAIPPLGGQVMRHWRRYLEQQALIEADPGIPPTLTADGLARMEAYLDRLAEAASDLPQG